jgi:hypothetical protein
MLCWIMVCFSGIVGLAIIYDPPNELTDIAIAFLLLAASLYMVVQTAFYKLAFKDNVIYRSSPWPWEKKFSFPLNEIHEIDIRYQALHATVVMKDNSELSIPILLKGSSFLLHEASEKSDAKVSQRVKAIVDNYS